MTHPLLTIVLAHETDVVLTRQRARQLAASLGFDGQDQTRIATAVSELARNAHRYAGGGRVEFSVETDPATDTCTLLTRITDTGPGIADLSAVLDGRYVSRTGMGIGIVGARRLSDRFELQSEPGRGTRVLIGKTLPRGTFPTPGMLGRIADELARRIPQGPLEEVRQQNQELLRTLDALRARQAEVERLNLELEETNRGVMALYGELDDKAQSLRQASELKSRFLSHMTHELRTPLNSIIMVSRQMLRREDGELGEEYARQADLILRSAEGLLELVNDLLDLAKIEAGRVDVRPGPFTVADLFGALRGMFRPVQTNPDVGLSFETPPDLAIFSDEGKVSQVLRNLISNALKFTQRGSVRVSAEEIRAVPPVVRLSVADTGVGISDDDQRRLFQDFSQLDPAKRAAARGVKGTGLGLSLSRRLAELLGGRIEVWSEPGVGSRFTLVIPTDLRLAGATRDGADAVDANESEVAHG
jgi:signal transduction histidine kinase